MRTAQPRMTGPVLTANCQDLHDAGFPLARHEPGDPCPVCTCRIGNHQVVLPHCNTEFDLLDRVGNLECDTCSQSCGTWSVLITDWL